LISAHPEAGLVVDLKADGSVEALAQAIATHDLAGRVIVGSFSGERLARFRVVTEGSVATSTGPIETMRALLGGRWAPLFDLPAMALQVPVSWYGVEVVTERLVRQAHRAGKLVHVWTVNRPADMRRLLDLGVDGIITDRPDLLAPLLAGGSEELGR
jgi:glycerophosphoryl diester phosphodiesterase